MLPALVVGPKRVVRHVWSAEVEKWGFDLSVAIADGTPKRKQKAVESGADITCIPADSLKYAVGGPWRTMIADEVTLFKNQKSARWKLAKKIARAAERYVGMTGSPTAGAGLIDLWAQIDLLSDDNPLGDWWQFTQRHFYFDHFNRPHARKGAEDAVGDILKPWIFRRTLAEIEMPGLVTNDIVVGMNTIQRKAMQEAELEENGTFARHRTIAAGFAYEQHWSGTKETKWLGDSKVEAMQEIRRETAGENLLVLCNFQAEADRLAAEFGAPILDGRTSAKSATAILDDWNSGRLGMLIGNCMAMSHGLNLQSGGRRVVWFSLPVSQEVYDQAVARLWRSGQTQTVMVDRIIAEDSIDQDIARLLSKKSLSQLALLSAEKQVS